MTERDVNDKKLIELAAIVAGMPGGDFGADIIMGRGHGVREFEAAENIGEVLRDEIEVVVGEEKKSSV